jgi:hypothetical protein
VHFKFLIKVNTDKKIRFKSGFLEKRKILTKKDGITAKKRGGVCVRLLAPSRFVSKTDAFCHSIEHDCPRGCKKAL